jgi:long-chain fatty acid transport protein
MRITTAAAIAASCAGLSAGARTANANSFYLSEHDAREVGRGDTGVATDTDPSGIFYNPAGIAVGSGTQFSIGAALIAPDASFTPTGGTKETSNTSPQVLPNAYVTHKFGDLIAVGLGFHAPFGLEVDWPTNSTTADNVQTIALRTYYLSGVVGLDLNKFVPGLSVAAGIDVVPATVELLQAEYFGADHTCTNNAATEVNCGEAHIAGNATGVGGRFGAMWRPGFLPRLSLGVMYNTEVKLDFTGNAAFIAPAPFRASLPPDGPASTDITLPQRLVAGAAYRPIDGLEIEANVSWVDWKKFETLTLNLPGPTTAVTPEGYTDTVSVRVGAEYAITHAVAVRVGYIFDPTPVPAQNLTPQLPDADRNDLTVGATFHVSNFDIHAALLYVISTSRDTPPATGATMYQPEYHGTFDISALVAALQLTGKF